ncbi:hypothetical protein KBX19_05800 [Corynebacterium sp. CCUG 71335]|uniref:hypothetical protein n=1 Tax=Corynebacterium sp. CCUG 71335 TaxID=2823892 RepID=UPI00210C408C|nr:hypothetical protein [Corynebacterium sp. CCUG 71335]MCQ4620722.1 hypothetical protein [Corynebacterium sp. CCUG 71335]
MQLCGGVEVEELERWVSYAQISRAAILAINRDTDYRAIEIPPIVGSKRVRREDLHIVSPNWES